MQPTGVRSYYARFGRSRRIALAKVGRLLPYEARERCQKVLGNVAHGRHPLHGLGGDGLTLGQFIDETYAPRVKANRPRTAAKTLGKLSRLFGSWFAEPLSRITIERIESWKIRRVNAGRVATTVMRDIFTVSSVLRRAVRLGKLADNPVRWVDKPRIDRRPKIRFLDEREELRLRAALNAREITRFRWHDLRHHFASRLVQESVPLNTVRDLLGHSSMAMSLRYAHLAPDLRRETVAKLNEKPLLALTMRLQGNHDPTAHFYPIDFMVVREGLEPSTSI